MQLDEVSVFEGEVESLALLITEFHEVLGQPCKLFRVQIFSDCVVQFDMPFFLLYFESIDIVLHGRHEGREIFIFLVNV